MLTSSIETKAIRDYRVLVAIYGRERIGRILMSILERVAKVEPIVLDGDSSTPHASDEALGANVVSILTALGVVKLGRQGREE